MVNPNSPIPPERYNAYLQNAQAAFNEAAAPIIEPAIVELGQRVVQGAEDIVMLNPAPSDRTLADNAAKIAQRYDSLAVAPPRPLKEEIVEISMDEIATILEGFQKLKDPPLTDMVWANARKQVLDPRFDNE